MCSFKIFVISMILLYLSAPIIIFSIALVTHKPKLYIEDFYIPALKTPTTSNATRLNTFIFIDLKLENVMPFNGIRYGNVNLTFYYNGNRSLPVADYTFPGFYQGNGKTAHRRVVLRTHGMPWEDAFREVSGGTKVVFGVDLVTTVKLKRCGAYTKRKAMVAGGDVRVDGSGEEVYKKAIRLD